MCRRWKHKLLFKNKRGLSHALQIYFDDFLLFPVMKSHLIYIGLEQKSPGTRQKGGTQNCKRKVCYNSGFKQY